jgi:RNA recognition motif-containing protein
MNIYVGNLALETTSDELKHVFSVFGEVNNVVMMNDGNPNRLETISFAYIEMNVKSEGFTVINNLKSSIIRGRVINVIEALPLSARRIEMHSWKSQDGAVKVKK